MKRELFVGGVFVLVLGMLLTATILVNDPGFFRESDGDKLFIARFRDVAGLTDGAEVWVSGTPRGRVKSVAPDGRGGVQVEFLVRGTPALFSDAEVTIRPRSALGGAVVAVSPGTPDKGAWEEGTVFAGRSMSDPFHEISAFAEENKEAFHASLENIRKITGDIANRSEEILANLDEAMKNAKSVTEKLDRGDGTLAKLLNDGELHGRIDRAAANIESVTAKLDQGSGTLGRLLNDTKLYDDAAAAVERFRSAAAKLDSGEGTLGKLLNDSKPFDDLATAADNLRQITEDARGEDSLLGKLLYDKDLGKRLDTISRDIVQITAKINHGDGTIAKLINDDSVYTDLKSALRSLRAGSDDVRENAPVLTFAGFLFSGF